MGVSESAQEQMRGAMESMAVEQESRRRWLDRFNAYIQSQGRGYRLIFSEVAPAYKAGENAEQAAAKFLEQVHEGAGS